MNVNIENAKVVSAIFSTLGDERFNMRSVRAIQKAGEDLTVEQVLDIAAQTGCKLRRRMSDDRLLIQRPCPVADAQAIAAQAAAVLAGTGEPFEVDFTATQETPAALLGLGEDGDSDEEQVVGAETAANLH